MVIVHKTLEHMLETFGSGTVVRSDTVTPEKGSSKDTQYDWVKTYQKDIVRWVQEVQYPIEEERLISEFPGPLDTALLRMHDHTKGAPIDVEWYACKDGLIARFYTTDDTGEYLSRRTLKNGTIQEAFQTGDEIFEMVPDEISIVSVPGKGTDLIIAFDYQNTVENPEFGRFFKELPSYNRHRKYFERIQKQEKRKHLKPIGGGKQ